MTTKSFKIIKKLSNFILILFILPSMLIAQDTATDGDDDDKGWYLQPGIALVGFDESAVIAAGGAIIPGADATLSNATTFGLVIGYKFSSKFSAIALVGVPPKTDIVGKGTAVDGVPVGSLRYAPAVLAVNYHLPLGKFKPFVGAGFNYTIVLKEFDNAVVDLDAKNMLAPAVRVGFEIMFSKKLGLFASANKIWGSTNATGMLGGTTPVDIDAKLNPLIIHIGLTYHL